MAIRVLGIGGADCRCVELDDKGVGATANAFWSSIGPSPFCIPSVMKCDYFFVLPWHFNESILRREQEYISQGGKFIFPFPEIEIA